MDCGDEIYVAAAIHKLNYILPRELRRLVDCGSAAVGVVTPQYKPFYTVPSNTRLEN